MTTIKTPKTLIAVLENGIGIEGEYFKAEEENGRLKKTFINGKRFIDKNDIFNVEKGDNKHLLIQLMPLLIIIIFLLTFFITRALPFTIPPGFAILPVFVILPLMFIFNGKGKKTDTIPANHIRINDFLINIKGVDKSQIDLFYAEANKLMNSIYEGTYESAEVENEHIQS